MTSTSFNPIGNQQATIEQNQPLSLKQGQVFHGTIKKLYPDQMAEIQVGQHKLYAKLETPLKASDSHFFQVTNMNPQAELKVVTGPMQQSQTTSEQLNQFLETMNLPKTKEMQQVLSNFVKTGLPLSKETLLQAENWLKALPFSVSTKEALQAIQKMAELKLPFTNEIFKGLIFGAKNTGISSAINNLTNLLLQDINIEPFLKSNILQQLQMISKPLAEETGEVLLSKVVQNLLSTEPSVPKSQLLNLLKNADILPKNATTENWLTLGLKQHQNISNESVKQPVSSLIQSVLISKPSEAPEMIQRVQTWINNQSNLSQEQKAQLQELVNRFNALPKTPDTIELFAKQLHEQLVKAFTGGVSQQATILNQGTSSQKEVLLSLLKPDAGNPQATQTALLNLLRNASESSFPSIQNLQMQADAEVLSSLDGKMMEQAIKTVLKGLGLSYEASLNSKMSNLQELAQSLKPQLLTLIQDSQISSAVKEAADNILSRVNGMQLTSGENGHQHQLVMQVPLQFLGKQTEATLQWNGRMKANGKIDANYARILFYLNMEALEETMVDMQVQNRIISIHLYNNQPQLELLAEPLKEALKKGLADKNYQLSGLFVKPLEKNTTSQTFTFKQSNESRLPNGVDIRI